uniref:hypothetical protein n=1 Tax=Paraburkholderia atlantica TaxID=2654982 RepID=UPI001D1260CB
LEGVFGEIDAQQSDIHDGLRSVVDQGLPILPCPLAPIVCIHPPEVGRGHSTISGLIAAGSAAAGLYEIR